MTIDRRELLRGAGRWLALASLMGGGGWLLGRSLGDAGTAPPAGACRGCSERGRCPQAGAGRAPGTCDLGGPAGG